MPLKTKDEILEASKAATKNSFISCWIYPFICSKFIRNIYSSAGGYFKKALLPRLPIFVNTMRPLGGNGSAGEVREIMSKFYVHIFCPYRTWRKKKHAKEKYFFKHLKLPKFKFLTALQYLQGEEMNYYHI